MYCCRILARVASLVQQTTQGFNVEVRFKLADGLVFLGVVVAILTFQGYQLDGRGWQVTVDVSVIDGYQAQTVLTIWAYSAATI